MLRVELTGDVLALTADKPTGGGEPRLVIAFPPDGTWRNGLPFVTTYADVEAAAGVGLWGLERFEDPTTGIVYKLVPQKENTVVEETQLDLLVNYIMAHCPFEIGEGDPTHGEGVVEVTIRLMGRMANGIDRALHELGRPDEGYPAPVANAVKILQAAFGLWGQGLES